MADGALAASPSEARSPLPPVPSIEEGGAVGVPGVLRAAAASGVPTGRVGSSGPSAATEPASATDPLSAPEIDEESEWLEESEGIARFGWPGSFFVVALAPAGRPEVEAGIAVGVVARLGVATWVAWERDAVEASSAAEACPSAPGSAGVASSAVSAGAWAAAEPAIPAGAGIPAGAALAAAGASAASAVGAT
jgi:hypothetical protein